VCPAVPNINVFHITLWQARHEANINSEECKNFFIFLGHDVVKSAKKLSDSRILSQSENIFYIYFRNIIITSSYSNWEVKCISLLPSSAFVVTNGQCLLFLFSPWCETKIYDLNSESFFFPYLTYL
jgi:hypothetical protein